MNITNAARNARSWMISRPWRVWAIQSKAIVRQELKQNLFSRRGVWVYLLAFAPAVVLAIDALRSPGCEACSLDDDTTMFAATYQLYYLRMGIFFGVMGIFTWLFRSHVVQRTLHYALLAPVRRELLIISKFLAGSLMALVIFGVGVLASFSIAYWHFAGRGYDYVFHGPGLEQLLAYLGITALASIGYGAIFLTLTIVFKNPIIPGICMLG